MRPAATLFNLYARLLKFLQESFVIFERAENLKAGFSTSQQDMNMSCCFARNDIGE
jgi:hypothetical protein